MTQHAPDNLPPPGEQDLLLARRGVTAALVGLGVQFALAVAAFVALVAARAEIASPPLIFAAVGVVPWAVVAVVAVFRRARTVEAFELEAARRQGDAAGRTIFDSEADARPAARRLDRLCRVGLPAASALAGVALLFFGVQWLSYALRTLAPPIGDARLAAAVLGAAAFAGFVAGYYLMGLGQGLRWPTLKGGAVWLLGTVLLLAGAAATTGAAAVGTDLLVGPARIVLPAAMLLIGVEVLLNLVVDLYRPRPAGDREAEVRPAFASRLVELVVSPGGVVRGLGEAISYQFGVEVTRSWFWRLLSRSFAWLILFGVGVLVLVSSFVVVGPGERAVVTTFGRLDGQPRGPGLHLKWPWPASRADLVDVGRLRELIVGTHLSQPGQHAHDSFIWASQDDGLEDGLFIVGDAAASDAGAGSAESGDAGGGPTVGLAAADLVLRWRPDPDGLVDLLTQSADVTRRLRQIAEAALAAEMARHDVMAVVGPRRQDVADAVARRVREAVEAERLGVEVAGVALVGVMPPKEAAQDFDDQIASRQAYRQRLAEGEAAAARTLAAAVGSTGRAQELRRLVAESDAARRDGGDPEEVARLATLAERELQQAGGAAAELLFEARAARWRQENDAVARAARLPALRAAWDAVPDYFRRREALRLIESALPGRPKVVIVSDSPGVRTRYDLEDAAGASPLDNIRPAAPEGQ